MEFLNIFSLQDVAIVLTGLIIVSIIRIYYDSYVNKQKAKRFGSSLGIYNSLIDETKEGMIILDQDKVIFSNLEAADILHVRQHEIETDYLSTLKIREEFDDQQGDFLTLINDKEYIPNAYLEDETRSIPLSISVNHITPYSHNDGTQWRIVILQDRTHINELRQGAESLLAA